MNRRDFLRLLGLGAAAPLLVEPVRRMWFVPSSAPVGSRVERLMPPISGSVRDAQGRELMSGWVQYTDPLDPTITMRVSREEYAIRQSLDAADRSPWWQAQIDNLERSCRTPTQEHSGWYQVDEHKAWTEREGYQPPEPLREMAQRVEESGARIAAIQKQFGLPIHNALLKGPWYVRETWR